MAEKSEAKADEAVAQNATSGGALPIEELAKTVGVSPAVHAGTVETMGWAAGKQVTRADYEAAVRAFTGASISSRKGK